MHTHSFSVSCTGFSQQQVYQPAPHKLDCCYFSGFRVLKLYFKPTVNDFAVLLFHKPLITGNDSLFNGTECLQTVLSVQLAPLLLQAGGAASAAQLPRAGQGRAGWSQLLLLSPSSNQQMWYFPASPTSPRAVGTRHRNTHVLGCFLWASCSGGGNQTIYQQCSSGANHSPVKQFYWTQQFKNIAWIQRVKALLLSPLFPWAGKNPHHPPHQKLGMRRRKGGRKTNKYIETGHSEVGPSVLIIYYTFLPV